MPDEAAVQEPEEDEDDLLAALLADDDDDEPEAEVEEKYERDDRKLEKKLKAVTEIVAKNERQKQADHIYDSFMAEASDTEKELFGLYADDDMTPAQMKKVIDHAKRKAAALAPPEDVDAEEEVNKRAAQIAQQRWGAGPIRADAGKKVDEEAELMDRIAKGDVNAYLDATFQPPKM
jgi:hypothetical protein